MNPFKKIGNYLKKIWDSPTGKIASRISLVIAILMFIFFTPFMDKGTTNLYSKIHGSDITLELKYPPINENQILVLYKNSGSIDLTNIQIEYTSALTPTGPFRTKRADITDKYLLRGQTGEFYINISNIRHSDCKLLLSNITARLYYDSKNNKCYYLISPVLEGFCIPSKINITILSKEKTFYKEYLYPLSVNHTQFSFYQGEIECQQVFNNSQYSYLPYQTEDITEQMVGPWGLNDSYKLAKKYCHEEIMPSEWCLKNDLF